MESDFFYTRNDINHWWSLLRCQPFLPSSWLSWSWRIVEFSENDNELYAVGLVFFSSEMSIVVRCNLFEQFPNDSDQ